MTGGRGPAAGSEPVFVQAVALHEEGRLDQAEQLYRAILDNDRRDIGALYNLAILRFQLGEYQDAVALTREVLGYRPDLAVAHNTLAVALRHLDWLAEAEASCREAVRLAPEFAVAHNTLADTLRALGRFEEAEACCREALRLAPEYAEAHNNLGIVLVAQGLPEEGELAYREALRLKPDNPAAYSNLGNALKLQGKLSSAAAAFGRAAAIKPDDDDAFAAWFYLKQRICDWSGESGDEARFRSWTGRQASPSIGFRLLGVASTSAEQLAFARQASARLALPETAGFRHPRARPGDKLRVGYLMLEHPTAHLIVGIAERHDRRRFEVVGYSATPEDGSAMRRRLTAAFDRFADISDMPDLEAARLIHADRLDILVDLIGFKPDCRPEISARRPAPVQVNYLGYPATMGADYIDYILVDRFVVPPDQQCFFSERLVHLPGCYQCNDDRRVIAERTPSRAECGLPDRGFVFCCFNDSYKITPALFDIWMRLLREVPDSVLWLLDAEPGVTDNLVREAAARGVSPARLVFAVKLPLPDHLARHRCADLFLDTLPYNAHLTASDALWAGLPVLTCAGHTFAGRVAGSLLHTIGLAELVTTSIEEYEGLALRLAHNTPMLARLHARLAANRRTSPLFDTGRSARNLEEAYQRMSEIRRAGQPPEAFGVPSAT